MHCRLHVKEVGKLNLLTQDVVLLHQSTFYLPPTSAASSLIPTNFKSNVTSKCDAQSPLTSLVWAGGD